ncbi:tRNA (adenosine(37)-N6)-threonylcarbamoyltransferase complex ATPase subunit type 1 TsaE [Legionella jamestowniensis]|uniref:tRNA threonylcarbamoyladenosine biosynthesis protein TsaE n=1 Tax=Legionella jamestowniensis TaxID=455 RepID=A0A0W0UYQ4_9GAMM|nr:tRNA (adenosine(37)-N6)-threonylcarbamoyltransferase complex ATPase subunit type 1 TsaE [Legionella jamestowniensis]KTD13009.1 ATPase or kinase [Legionella jamestowniensis]OCH98208.1 tRNA (N6-adenosine(37)-N6)-threonylcarbamoyltransferase complex ATPase TsaE [Legionella jamestowniensis]SFL79386.1 tRNA threonylcarbamoyladenosine biosynthesis protein TsaE [Legionella jamestowniensis DSM 19215]
MIETDMVLPDEHSSEILAAKLAPTITPPLILSFSGEIGAGKTTFIRALLRTLGITGAIKSPTFSLVESYQCKHFQLHHFDLYRIHDESELEYIGFRDYFREDSICCIEWPEHAGHFLNKVDMSFSFAVKGHGRLLSIKAASPVGDKLLSQFAGKE